MSACLSSPVWSRFKSAIKTGAPTSEDDQVAITKALSNWASAHGATMFAHWFFPSRGGGGMVGGHSGIKHDSILTMRGLDAFDEVLPRHALWRGETDGSSFPNGGLRATHTAAAYTTWDRTSAPVIVGNTLLIPACFVSWRGNPLDDKTPLLRAEDAICKQGMRFLKAIGQADGVEVVRPYLGWEQEFFVVSAELYKKRPDLVACGRTLLGAGPTKGQQGDLNYFARVPSSVKAFLDELTAELLAVGCPVACYHNEVAPGQHEISPMFTTASQSCDYNELMMEMAADVARRHGLVVLFHEKPFAGINGSGKHNNWSVGTDTGVNFFSPGSTKKQQELFMASVAALAYTLNQHNTVIRAAVAGAGNDHRLGAQEAPPAIVSLYPGTIMEKKFKDIIAGAELHGYSGSGLTLSTGAGATVSLEAAPEDRNRTAPFPFCGNRWEFRAVGSSQNCSVPMAFVNAAYADGLSALSDLIEGGMSLRDAVAKTFKDNSRVIFTGNGYSAAWPVEAESRGLPNLRTTVEAVGAFASTENKAMFARQNVLTDEDVDARQEIMFENFLTTLQIEAETMIRMVDQGIVQACARDLANFAQAPDLAGDRQEVYGAIVRELKVLKAVVSGAETVHGLDKECAYYSTKVRGQMAILRTAVDQAEVLCADWPYPSYSDLVYSHHT